MKRTGSGEGYSVMKKGHEEKSLKQCRPADLRYAKYGMDNEKELYESTEKLAGYVKSHRMKY